MTSIDYERALAVTGPAQRRGVKKGIPDAYLWAKPCRGRPTPIVVVLETSPTAGLNSNREPGPLLYRLGVHWAAPRTIEELTAAVASVNTIAEAPLDRLLRCSACHDVTVRMSGAMANG